MKIKATIDRFEGYYAVLLVGEEEGIVDWPKNMLPSEAKEGEIITISMSIDKNETQRRRKRVEGLLDKLKNKNQG
ncbi:DUF3006 domain-containing protein [Heliorestis convoluta]|uniref:DUF3006 domain-containing protein n=1 Tax=Heliorestis convoluta TaxID=356322 RepID=A0A5Q2MX35_9FIRM|nr:DUF3006 domain-containing protein [Heliorestis convoluta]QGG46331.1 hypothetical protein FTV88_0152 [Heliorestis convoluta]